MPTIADKLHVQGTMYDRRVKLTSQDREEIKEKGAGYGIRKMAREYGVDKRLIQFILYPERLEASRKNRDWRRYHDRKKLTKQSRYLRHRKMKLYKLGILKIKKGGEKI